jgi:tetratricopeptide (TPR) repeat protein
MDTQFSPPSSQPVSPAPSRRRGIGLWTWLGLFAVILTVTLSITGKPLYRFAKHHYALYRAEKCLTYIGQQNWLAAMRALSDANRFDPNTPEVIRANIAFLTKTSNDPRELVITLKRLAELGHALPADYLLLGQSLLSLGDVPEARRVHAGLTPAQQDSQEGLELLAQILRSEGRQVEAEKTLRLALSKSPNKPESILRLALLDYGNSFPEIQNRARQSMWELTRNQDETALTAIGFLAQDKFISAPETERLLRTVEAHPDAKLKHRLSVISAIMRLSPHRQEELIAAEVAKAEGKPIEEMVEVITWLASEKQHARILRMVPPQMAIKHKEILPYIAQALGEEGRWADLKLLLTSGEKLPVSRGRVEVWLAQTAAQLTPNDRATPRQYLESAVESAIKTDDFGTLAAASQVAEAQGLYDLGIRCYDRLGTANPRMEIDMLERMLDLALRLRDTPRMLEVSQKLLALRPTSGVYRDRCHYLRLLAGTQLETVQAELDLSAQLPVIDAQITRIPSAFLRALAAHRFDDQAALTSELVALEGLLSRLNPGQRAVVAGLLHLTGREVEAFRIAESINDSVLLPEERALFKIARES